MIVTAYCACVLCCGATNTLTASGRRPVVGIVAAPRNIPFGTRVRIAGRTYVVADRLAPRFEGRWDIFMKSHAEARRFGKQNLTVTIIP